MGEKEEDSCHLHQLVGENDCKYKGVSGQEGAGSSDGVCFEVKGVGIFLDANACNEYSAPLGKYRHRRAFRLASPHIPPADEVAGDSERKKKRKRKQAVQALQHPDATAPELVRHLSAALESLIGTRSIFRREQLETFHNSKGNGSCKDNQSEDPDLRILDSTRTGARACYELDACAGGGHRKEPGEFCSLIEAQERGRLRGCPVLNTSKEHEQEVLIGGHRYIVPARAGFYLGQAEDGVKSLVASRVRADLVLADPPWPCRSRGKKYDEIPLETLAGLDVGNVSQGQGIVGVWVTNNDKLVDFVKETLLPSWGASYCATWYWIKVTDQGEPVSPLTSPHKKPFERLILGRSRSRVLGGVETGGGGGVISDGVISGGRKTLLDDAVGIDTRRHPLLDDALTSISACGHRGHGKGESQMEWQTLQGGGVWLEDPPDGWVIVSQPGQHSRKPFVGHLLSRHLPRRQPAPASHRPLQGTTLQGSTLLGEPGGGNDFKGIELFARELRSGWMCLGDQALKFNGENHVRNQSDLPEGGSRA